MIIIWGSKQRRRGCGCAPEWCPVCREVTVMLATEVRRVPHVYWIPLGRGQPVAIELTCPGCGALYGEAPGGRRFSPRGDFRAEDLVLSLCDPDHRAALTARVAMEGRARAGRLGSAERLALLTEPMLGLRYMAAVVGKRGASESVTAVIGFLALASIVAEIGVLFMYFDRIGPRMHWGWPVGVGLVAAVFGAWAVTRGVRGPRLKVRAHTLDLICRSLAPLRPRSDELVEAVAQVSSEVPGLSADDIERGLSARIG